MGGRKEKELGKVTLPDGGGLSRRSRRVRKLDPVPPPSTPSLGKESCAVGERKRKGGRRQEASTEEEVTNEDGEGAEVKHKKGVKVSSTARTNKVGGAVVKLGEAASSVTSSVARRSRDHHHRSRCRRLTFMSWIFLMATCSCSQVGVVDGQQQQQSFRVKPEPVEVQLGDQAVLRCEVDNQVGQAQWTKDGFALGLQREISGWPRYAMIGDSIGGVHNLQIQNVTLQDIADYQCQVLPNGPIMAIRSEDARLEVLVPPRSVEIGSHAPDATITVKEESIDLECVVRDARPAATISWYKNDQILRTENLEDVPELVDITADGVTTRSIIKILPTSEDDQPKYTCEARHKALLKPQKVSVFLNFQYPPGAPRIGGYKEGEPIGENKSVTLICASRGGNPLAELIWYKNDMRLESSYFTLGRESRAELTIMPSTKDHLARLRCEASNSMISTPKIAHVVLTVMFDLKEVKIAGPSEAAPGDNVTLTCTTSNSNPKAEIAWFRGGQSVEALHTYSTPSPDGGSTTSSNVYIPIYDTDRVVSVACQGVNKELGESKVATHTINVIQPPGRPRIYKTSLNMTAGHSQPVTCTSTGGHPPPTLQWYKGSKKVESRLERKGNMVTAQLTLEASPSDNGEVYRCKAKNKAISKALSKSITFYVLFPPTHVNITVNPQVLKEGQRANLTCESASSNPPAMMSWWKDSVLIPSHSNYILPGDNRGKRAVSVLMLDLTAELDNAVVTCSANNFAVRQYAHDALTLQVAYKPKFIQNPGEKVTVAEGKSVRISVKAKGNPDQVTYKWSKSGDPVLTTKGKVTVDGPELSFMDVSRKDKGKYEIEAMNKEGTSTLSVELDVQYPATVDTPFPVIMIGEGELATMECVIDANPLAEWMLQWGHESGENTSQLGDRAEKGFQESKSYLTIKNVTAADAGLYYCAVNNGIGEATNGSIHLIVKHKPELDLSPQIAKAASNKGGRAKLICRAKGAPNVTFSWSREGRALTNETEPAKYSVQYQQVDLMIWESILVVKDVQSRDYGAYECVARNELGDERHHTVRLTSHPEPLAMVKIIIISASIIGTLLLLLNIVVVSYLIYKKKGNGKGKQDGGSEQGSSKSATIELYLHGGHPIHHEDDGYADALLRSVPTSRHPHDPPIPEYCILPEASYLPCPPPYGFGGSPVGNGSVLLPLSHSASHTMLNHLPGGGVQSFQPNGSLITASNGPLWPGRLSILTMFAPNPSPNNMEQEGLLV